MYFSDAASMLKLTVEAAEAVEASEAKSSSTSRKLLSAPAAFVRFHLTTRTS